MVTNLYDVICANVFYAQIYHIIAKDVIAWRRGRRVG